MTASYDYHIGVDYHKSYSHLVVQDSSGKTLRSGRVKNDRQSLGGFLERYRENSHAVVEATRNWMVMYDWLDDICDDVVLAHPWKVKAIADAKIKTDKIDATVLAHLLRADLVPEAWAPGERARELRVALRERIFYVGLRTLAAYAGLQFSTYASGGKTYHGKIIRQGNKWLRWAFVEAVSPAVPSDVQLRTQYDHLKIRGINKARVAVARKLMTIAFQIMRDRRAYEPRDTSPMEGASTISRLS